jgi:hypothetical protein
MLIQSAADEAAFRAYAADRDAIRDVIQHGVYPNAVKALEVLTAFQAQHGPGGALHREDIWALYTAGLSELGDIQERLFACGVELVALIEEGERRQPGVFGITPPPVEATGEGKDEG